MSQVSDGLERVARQLAARVDTLRFGPPVAHVYNPLDYAWQVHRAYLRLATKSPEVLLLGMNPGPWGMAQTGVPFGDVKMVKEWLGLEAPVGKPPVEHPRRPVSGFACTRAEQSGRRFWGWARDRFGSPARFFSRFFVLNYCPLVFYDPSGRNITPDHLRAVDRTPLLAACDHHLSLAVEVLQPRAVLGLGRFAEGRATRLLGSRGVMVGGLPHPSPANPAAGRDWGEKVDRRLYGLGVSTT